ncbi:lipid-A-disaccharide synthase [Aporhodopirellula aestuarii]|uniref:Lipid-A-disaccharide synthase n=1 Tax=Aporhodopirellula aestuarii TaxID=2950107 RepID=A0ABT0U9K1_9BACT|nr:lipid-A-disaccharide synthase [Aporhodopirellula aestuarii]MCM2373446.1 lipid-A-disaccharide synthase [Aporhodopirellula aestuarii]
MSKTLFFSVGEPSGDQHAARLIAELRGHYGTESVRCRGFGGPEMQAAGCSLDLDLTRHAVVGLVEVLPKLRSFFRFADQAEQTFASGSVDGVVLVDFPGFNWHIAKRAKKYGIPVYYYCPPQLWAWGAWRVRKMRRSVDHVMTVLPIETTFFGDHGIPVSFVGHPFFDAVAEKKLDTDSMRQLNCQTGSTHTGDDDAAVRTVAVLPGSRDHEVQRNFPIMLETIRRLQAQEAGSPKGTGKPEGTGKRDAVQTDVRYAVAAYRDRHCLWCRDQLTEADRALPIDFFVDRTSEVIEAAHCAMMVSGSVSLELMARGTPAAVIYRVGRILHAVGKRVLRVDSVTLPNLMAGRKVFPEFVSVGDVEPAIDFLHETIRAMLHDQFYYRRVQSDLAKLRDEYGLPGASRRSAEFLAERLGLSRHNGDNEQTIRRIAA